LPGDGVYAGIASWDALRKPAAISIGNKPTFGGRARFVEAYLMDFSGDLYDRKLGLEFHGWIRAQRKFDSPEDLRRQIDEDVRGVSTVLGHRCS